MVDAGRTPQDVEQTNKELASLRKLWLIFALLAVAVSLNVLMATQGGAVKLSFKAAFGIDFDKDTPEAVAALWGIIYLTIFTGMASGVAIVHARKSSGDWGQRFPFRTFDLPPSSGVGRAMQILMLILLMLAPLYFLGHSWSTFQKHAVLCVEVADADWRPRKNGSNQLFTMPAGEPSAPTRVTSNEAIVNNTTCKKGSMTDYWAPVQTWAMAFLSSLAVLAFLTSLFEIFRPKQEAS